MSTPRGFIVLTTHLTGRPNMRVAVQAIATYARTDRDPETAVTLLSVSEDHISEVYYVPETVEEIDALICADQERA